ncbi:MAG: CoA ester lyase [Rhodomicrobiaceae bacterium]
MPIRPRRSVLYMPGSNARALEKAKTLPADALIFDLEDAIAPDAKDAARDQAVAAVTTGGYGKREIAIRVNALTTPWGEADLRAVAGAGAGAILIPNVETPGHLEAARSLLRREGIAPTLALWAMMETPLAILNAAAIAAAAAGEFPLTVLVMGTNDLAKETRVPLGRGRLGMVSWLSICVAAGHAYGIDVLDGVYNAIGDDDGLRAELEQGLLLGMDGKTLIHPSQIGPCNEIFSPRPEEVEWARKLIAAFELPENSGKGVLNLDGRMVERLHADIARRMVTIADMIAEREASA